MEIAELIAHPERMDRDTLYELRSLLALYPYFQPARLLMLQNLYLLHDAAFDEELRRAAIYIADRNVLFQMVEAGHYRLLPAGSDSRANPHETQESQSAETENRVSPLDSRTLSLIDDFLDSLPPEEETEKKPRRKPTPADAAVDYVAYLLESEEADDDGQDAAEVPQLKGQNLIDTFIEQDRGKIILNENPTLKPELEPEATEEEKGSGEGVYTETLARIYIKQGKYSKALEIIKHLSLVDSEKNAYFADQIRFLEKLIINSNNKK